MTAPFPIPDGVTYNGPMTGLPRPFHLFTDHETHSSFAIPMAVPSMEMIAIERDRIRVAFRAAVPSVRKPKPIRPQFARQPRIVAPVQIGNHC